VKVADSDSLAVVAVTM
jgi:hypothetical protein